jgi:hypothetical protein
MKWIAAPISSFSPGGRIEVSFRRHR